MTHTVEHTTYKHGDKQEHETDFENELEALEYAKSSLQRSGGRVWVNNVDYGLKELSSSINSIRAKIKQ